MINQQVLRKEFIMTERNWESKGRVHVLTQTFKIPFSQGRTITIELAEVIRDTRTSGFRIKKILGDSFYQFEYNEQYTCECQCHISNQVMVDTDSWNHTHEFTRLQYAQEAVEMILKAVFPNE